MKKKIICLTLTMFLLGASACSNRNTEPSEVTLATAISIQETTAEVTEETIVVYETTDEFLGLNYYQIPFIRDSAEDYIRNGFEILSLENEEEPILGLTEGFIGYTVNEDESSNIVLLAQFEDKDFGLTFVTDFIGDPEGQEIIESVDEDDNTVTYDVVDEFGDTLFATISDSGMVKVDIFYPNSTVAVN